MNKKFIALSMLMFASWSSNVVSMNVPAAARAMSSRTSSTKPLELRRVKSVNKLPDQNSENGLTTANLNALNKNNEVQLPVRSTNSDKGLDFDLQSNDNMSDISDLTENSDQTSPSYYDRAAQLGQQAKNAAYNTGKYLYDAPGIAVEKMGGNPKFITGESNSLYSVGKSMYDAPGIAFNAVTGGRKDFLSNPVSGSLRTAAFGRSKILTPDESSDLLSNNFENVTPSYNKKDRVGNDVSIFIDNNGNRLMKYTDLTEKTTAFIYTPATAMNLPARTIAALYDKLPTLSTSKGRQEFRENVSGMFKRAGNEQPTARTWNQFFASIKPDMNFLSFDNLFGNLFNKKAVAEVQPELVVAEPVAAVVENQIALIPGQEVRDTLGYEPLSRESILQNRLSDQELKTKQQVEEGRSLFNN